jgi:hypothetical protein
MEVNEWVMVTAMYFRLSGLLACLKAGRQRACKMFWSYEVTLFTQNGYLKLGNLEN